MTAAGENVTTPDGSVTATGNRVTATGNRVTTSGGNGTAAGANVVVAAAWVGLRDRRVLVVRATGSDAFYLPGGKPEPGETDAEAAAREVGEEVGLVVDPAALQPFVTLDAPAHNRPPGTRVRLVCFLGEATGPATEPVPANEIAELAWFSSADAPRCAPAIQLLLTELVTAGLID